jgi:hypothetical protein
MNESHVAVRVQLREGVGVDSQAGLAVEAHWYQVFWIVQVMFRYIIKIIPIRPLNCITVSSSCVQPPVHLGHLNRPLQVMQ